MKKKAKKSEINLNKTIYKIEIEVSKGGNMLQVHKTDKELELTHEMIIGTLELCKAALIKDKTENTNKL